METTASSSSGRSPTHGFPGGRRVLDAVGSECVSVFAMSESALPVILLTASGEIVHYLRRRLGEPRVDFVAFFFALAAGRSAARRARRTGELAAARCSHCPTDGTPWWSSPNTRYQPGGARFGFSGICSVIELPAPDVKVTSTRRCSLSHE